MTLPHAEVMPNLTSREDYLGEDFLAQVLTSLVRSRSVNPEHYETDVIATIQGWLEPAGINCHIVEFAEGRPSLAAVVGGRGSGPRLVINGHVDTVAIDDITEWASDPFELDRRDGYLYGRGACDMKAGLSAQIGTALYLATAKEPLAGSLIAHFAAGEECGEPGTLALLQAGFVGDFGIVTEPTQLQVAVAERGLCHFLIRIKGQSIHGSRAHLGVNPALELGVVISAVEAYDREIGTRQHALLPPGSCIPTVIRAGIQNNAVADTCDLVLDRRLLPGETVASELARLQQMMRSIDLRNPKSEIEVSVIGLPFEAAEISSDSAFAKIVLETANSVTGKESQIWGTPFASDVRNLVNDAGMEAVTFGPGNVAECHCANERVESIQLEQCAQTLVRVAASVLQTAN